MTRSRRLLFPAWLAAVGRAAVGVGLMASAANAQSENPITKMAHLVNSDLKLMEDRIRWLENRIRTMAAYHEHPLRVGIGAIGHRVTADSPDPYVLLDLGKVHDLDRIYLVPAQREYIGDTGIFPRRFTLELAMDEDFSDATMIFTTDDSDFINPHGRPIPFAAFDTSARYLRLTVHRGHNDKGWIDKFGFSEIITTAGNDAVSFGAEVTMPGSLDSGENWYPEALVDGRMPHGIWHSGVSSDDRGDGTLVDQASEVISWQLDLGASKAIDRMVLFPYKLTTSMESSVIPNRLNIEMRERPGAQWETVRVWHHRPASSSCVTPVVLDFDGFETWEIRVTAVDPWRLGDLRIQGLSEIQVWSGGENIALGLPVTRLRDVAREEIDSLTNGFTSEFMVSDVSFWLDQLHERLRFENELTDLRPRMREATEESELNITLASAILLSLTFMIPVYLFEKRRVKAKERLELLRKRIASDLHDDIGGNLGSISLIARSARRNLEKLAAPPELSHDLEEVESIARESSLAMRDIVWLLERRDDSVGDLVHRMQEAGTRLLRDVEYSLVCQSKRTDSMLSLDFKRHFFLFFKEALHNILKHAGAARVSIMLDDDGDDLVLEIQDDGVGMPNELMDSPETARKLKERARALGGRLSIHSSEGDGTRVRLAIRSKLLNTTPAMS